MKIGGVTCVKTLNAGKFDEMGLMTSDKVKTYVGYNSVTKITSRSTSPTYIVKFGHRYHSVPNNPSFLTVQNASKSVQPFRRYLIQLGIFIHPYLMGLIFTRLFSTEDG